MAFYLWRSNRLENLLAPFFGLMTEWHDPFRKEWVVVQNPGVSTWLSEQGARHFSVWAQVRYLYPRHAIEQLIQQSHPEYAPNPFDLDRLTWSLYAELPAFLHLPEFAKVAAYLADGDPLKRYQLARKLADLFDQYPLYRADRVQAWEQGKESHWQAVLWRKLVQEPGQDHLARWSALPFEKPELGQKARELPQRICLFGFSAMPPLFLRWFQRIAQVLDVHLFAFSPAPHYFGETQKTRKGERPEDIPHLLHQWGKLGADFQDLWAETIPHAIEVSNLFLPREGQGTLARLQREIQTFQTEAANVEADSSLQIHSFHNPLRACQGLKQFLFKQFQENPGLKPEEILVMSPQLDLYAPYIESVFQADPDSRSIPFHIADQPERNEGPVVQSFMALLQALVSRFPVEEGLDLIQFEPFQQRFDWSPEDLEEFEAACEQVKIDWGFNAVTRGQAGGLALDYKTWHFGLNRMLLGSVMPHDSGLFGGYLPHSQWSGLASEKLAQFVHFFSGLSTAWDFVQNEHPLEAWLEWANQLLDRYYPQTEKWFYPIQQVRTALVTWSQSFPESVCVPFSVFRLALQHLLSVRVSPHGFLSGGVTFCAMRPMRCIPHRIICLIGLDQSVFPRRVDRDPFNLMAEKPEPGDRNAREEDRYLFLESVLAARETLYLSYLGQSAKDGSEMVPSAVVQDLLDWIGPRAKDWVVQHPLHAHSAEYFAADSDLYTFETRDRDLLIQSLQAQSPEGVVPIRKPFPQPESGITQIALADLIAFWRNPPKYFLKRRCHLEEPLGWQVPAAELNLQPKLKNHLAQEVVDRLLKGHPVNRIRQEILASGYLLPASAGLRQWELVWQAVEPWQALIQQRLHLGVQLHDLEVDLPSGVRIVGRVITDPNLQLWKLTYSKPYLGAFLSLGIHLLTLSAANYPPPLCAELHFLEDKPAHFKGFSAPDPIGLLEQLCAGYRLGQTYPLPFFHRSGLGYLQGGKESAHKNWKDEVQKWEVASTFGCPSSPFSAHLGLAGENSETASFEALMNRVARPIFQAFQGL
ncbi:MAG: exodeoxyribonuclease V subunit gamma [Acidobacteria bacterium]|nr:exodeoxyribonuclease V subunit gamma [Acidobacteriota bacterium]